MPWRVGPTIESMLPEASTSSTIQSVEARLSSEGGVIVVVALRQTCRRGFGLCWRGGLRLVGLEPQDLQPLVAFGGRVPLQVGDGVLADQRIGPAAVDHVLDFLV